jgi:predicted dienelactone hydrolase
MMRWLFALAISSLILGGLCPLEGMHSRLLTRPLHQKGVIGVQTFSWHDSGRDRPVVAEVWYPIDAQGPLDPPADRGWLHPHEVRGASLSEEQTAYPVILMSHGHGGDRRDRSWLAERLVGAGFVVVSVDHYGNTAQTLHPLLTLQFWERAKDISFSLSALLQEPFFARRIDEEKVGFVGYSLGGMTGLGLAGAMPKNLGELVAKMRSDREELSPELLRQVDFSGAMTPLKDERIRGMVLLCPARFVYPPESLKAIRIPIGLVAAINDEVLPHKEHAYQIIKYLVPKRLKVMRKEISHYAFLNCVSPEGKSLLPEKLRSDPPACSRSAVHEEVASFAIDFFRDLFRNSATSKK